MEPVTKDYNCVVCFRDIFYCSVGVCEHSVCFECSARMRVLLGQNECPICRHELDHVAFTRGKRSYKDVQDKIRMFIFVPRYKIYMEDKEIQKQFDSILEARCLLCMGNDSVFKDFPALRHHIQRAHDLYACDLCVEHIKLFPVERRFYTRTDLAYHKRKGDKDDTSHRGHPLCQFCDRRYFDEDDLFKHLRKDHYFCHFCDADGYNHFYNAYDDLRVHFRCEHFLCEEENCKDEKFTSVFRTEIDLKAHLASAHSRLLGKHGLKQARHLDVEFNLAPRSEDNNGKPRRNFRDRGERSGGQGERHRERNTDAVGESHTEDNSHNSNQINREVVQVPPNLARLNLESSMDFPTLGGGNRGGIGGAQAGATPKIVAHASSAGGANLNANTGQSISQRLALSNGLNVASKPIAKDKNKGNSSKPNWNAKVSGSSKMDDEFPALRISDAPSSSSSMHRNSGQAGAKSFIAATKITPISSTKTSLPPDIKARQAVPRSEDFPELGLGSGSGINVGSAWSGSGVKMKQSQYQGKKVAPTPMLPGRSTQEESGSNGFVNNEEDFKFVPLRFSSDRNKSKNNNFGDYQRKKQ